MSRVNLGNVLYESGEFPAAREHYETALRFDPGHAEAHQGLAYVLAELGDEEGAQWHRRKGFEDRPVLALPYRGEGPPVSLLLLVSSVGGNIPTRHLLDDRVFQTFVVVPEFYDPNVPLPPHQVVFNAIGDADLAAAALAAAQSVVALTSGAGDQSALGGNGDRARRSRAAFAPAGRGDAGHRHSASGTARLSGGRGHGGAPRLPFPAAGAHARLSHGAPFSCAWKARKRWPARWRSFRGRN